MDEFDLKDISKEGAENLIIGVVRLAVNDWKSAKKVLERRPNSISAQRNQVSCENFFQSDYFHFLTGMNGREVLKRLEEEYENGRRC